MIFLRAKVAKYCSTLLREAQNHLMFFKQQLPEV